MRRKRTRMKRSDFTKLSNKKLLRVGDHVKNAWGETGVVEKIDHGYNGGVIVRVTKGAWTPEQQGVTLSPGEKFRQHWPMSMVKSRRSTLRKFGK